MSLTIRQAGVSDAEAISSLIVGLSDYFLSDPDSPKVRQFLDTLTPAATLERLGSQNFSYFVAEDRTRICGVIALRDGSHVYHLFVRSDVHRQGTARLLWEHILAQTGPKAFTVNSSLFAVPVYERFGFRAIDTPKTENGLTFVPMEYRDDS